MSLFVPRGGGFLQGPSGHLPSRVVTNEDVVARTGQTSAVQTKVNWIQGRTGIVTRHWAGENEACSDLAMSAAERLLAEKEIDRGALGSLILCTVSGDYPSPPTSPLVQHRLGLSRIGAFDLGAACAGFVTGLHVASGLCESTGQGQLLIASDIRSKFLNPADMNVLPLFGDGAAAAHVTARPDGADFRFLGSRLVADGSVADVIFTPAGGTRKPGPLTSDPSEFYIRMRDGAALFLKAVEGMTEGVSSFLKEMGVSQSEVRWLVPHQANLLMLKEISRRLAFPEERVVQIIQKTGNTAGASCGLALAELRARKETRRGEKVLLVAAGGGGLMATALLEAC